MSSQDADVIVYLPDEHRDAFKDPLGPVHEDVEELLAQIDGPLIAVGDVVTYHFLVAGRSPDVAVVDRRTKREAVDPTIEATLDEAKAHRIPATNPPGTLTASLLDALDAAIGREGAVQIEVDGEEDLAAVPAILLAPDDASVVYGQPDEGMVHVRVTPGARQRARELAQLLAGDADRLRSLITV